MIRVYDNIFAVDGKPLLTPDVEMNISETDIDEEDSGRDEAQFMHRFVARERVKTWPFSYALLDGQDLNYIKSLFAGKSTFTFSYEEDGQRLTTTAYCSKWSYKMCRGSSAHGIYKDFKFNIIEC